MRTFFMLPDPLSTLQRKVRIIGAELAEDGIVSPLPLHVLAIAELAGLVVDAETGTIVGLSDERNISLRTMSAQ